MENKVFTPITTEEATKYLHDRKVEIIEQFAKAYLAETGLKPSEVELVTKQESTGMIIETVYYFRKKE
jgi:predicted naringenin-chalcone synthase